MHVEPNLFQELEREWHTLCRSPDAVAALANWARREPALGRFASPAEVVEWCHQRDDARSANEVVGALLRVATDPLAARTLLQALLPAVAARAWRAARLAGDAALWTVADWKQEMAVAVLDRIRELAGTSPAWPAGAVVESAWWRVETAISTERRRRRCQVPLDATADAVATAERSTAEALVVELVGAVKAGRIDARAAGVIYTTRIRGHTFEQVAAWDGRGVAAVRKARYRAEMALAGDEAE